MVSSARVCMGGGGGGRQGGHCTCTGVFLSPLSLAGHSGLSVSLAGFEDQKKGQWLEKELMPLVHSDPELAI